MGGSPDGRRRLVRPDDLGRAEGPSEIALTRVLRRHHDLARGGEGPQRQEREQPDGPGPDDQHRPPRFHASPERGMDGAGERFHQDGSLVGEIVGDGVHLGPMGHQHGPPAAPGVGAISGLQPRRHMADRDPVAALGHPCAARGAPLDAAGRTGQHRLQDDPGPRRELLEVVEQFGDHLVAGDEGHGHQRREVERDPAGQRGQVGAADPRQSRLEPPPAGAGHPRLVRVHQPEWGQGTGEQSGSPPADGAGRRVPGHRSIQLERDHGTGSGRSTRGTPFERFQSSTGQCRFRATRNSDTSGFTATGLPTARSSGRSEWLSAYA